MKASIKWTAQRAAAVLDSIPGSRLRTTAVLDSMPGSRLRTTAMEVGTLRRGRRQTHTHSVSPSSSFMVAVEAMAVNTRQGGGSAGGRQSTKVMIAMRNDVEDSTCQPSKVGGGGERMTEASVCRSGIRFLNTSRIQSRPEGTRGMSTTVSLTIQNVRRSFRTFGAASTKPCGFLMPSVTDKLLDGSGRWAVPSCHVCSSCRASAARSGPASAVADVEEYEVENLEGEPSAESSATSASDRPTWTAHVDFKYIRDNREKVAKNVRARRSVADVDKVVTLYDEFTTKTQEVDSVRRLRNKNAAQMKTEKDEENKLNLIEQGKHFKDQLVSLEADLSKLTAELQREGQKIPNSTHPDVRNGTEEEATLRGMVGLKPNFQFTPKDHVELGKSLDLIDFDSAAEVSGQKFYYLKNEAVLLEMALINWSISKLVTRGFTPLSTPDLVRSGVLEKCGFQPRAKNTQVYAVEGMDLCLAGTSEIPVGGMFMDKILSESDLPLKLVAFSHCFRTEAGAPGVATRGLYRVHQFSKVEMFVICRPEESEEMLEELISIEEELYGSLGLHFKTLDMPSEDLGAPAYRKFDVEAWMPGLGRYGEISSASNCTDYQARRLNIRYRPVVKDDIVELPEQAKDTAEGSKKRPTKKKPPRQPSPQFVHTLNATACAVPRMIIAILESFQQSDGSVTIPEALQPFMGGRAIIEAPQNRRDNVK